MTTTLTQLSTEDLIAIRSVCEHDWTQFMLNADWDGMTSTITDDAVFLPPDQPIVRGKKAIREWMASFPAVKAMGTTVEHTEGRGDFALARGAFEMTVEPSPGHRVTVKGKYATAFRKQADGRWVVAMDLWNLDHPTSAA